jgi:phage-related protein
MSHIYAASALLLLSLPHGLASPVAQEVPVFRSLSSGRPARAAPTGNVVAMVGAPHRPRPAVVSSLENKLASYLAKPTRNSVEDPSTLVGDPFAFALPEAANVSVELSSGVSSITSTTTSTTTSTLTPSSPAEASIAAIQYKSIGSIATEVAPLAVSTPLIFVDPLLPTLPTPIEASGAILAAGVVADSPTPFANASVVASIVPLSSLNASVVAIPPVVESAIDLSSTVPSATALPLAAQPAVVESATPISSVVENVTTVTESVIAVPSAPETVVSLLSVVASDIPVASVIESAVLFASVVESVAPLFIATPLPSSVESAFPEVPVEEVLGPKAGALELTDFVSLVQKIADVISAFFHVLPPTADTPANILAPPASELEAPTDDLLLDDDEDVASKAKRDQQYLPMPPVTMALLLDILRNLTESAADTVRKTNTALSELSLDTGSDTLQGLGKRDTLTAEQQSLVATAAAKVAELQLATDALKALAKSQLTKREELAIDAADLYPTIQSLINTILTAFGIPTGTMSTNLAVDPVVALTNALGSIKGKLSARSEKRQVDPNASKDLLSKFVAILEHLIQITKNVSGASPVTPTTPVAGGPFSSLSGLNGKLPTSVPAFVGTGGPFAGTGGPFAGTGGPFAGTGGPLNGINPIGPPFLTGGPLAAIAALADKTPVDIASILAAPLSAASSAINVASVLSAPLASVSSVVVTLPDLPISSGSIGARGGSLRARQALGLLSSLQNLPNSAAPAAGAPGAVLLNGVQNLANPAPGVAGASPLNALQNVASPAQGVAGASPLNGVQNLVDTAQSVVGALPSVNILPLNLPSQSGSPVIGLVAGLAPKTNPDTGVLNVAPAGLVNSPTNPLASTLSPLTSALNPITSALSPLTSALSPLTSALNPFNTGFNPFPGLSSTLAGPGNVFGALNPFAGLKAGLLGGYSNPFAAYLGNFPTANLNPATGVVNALPVANVLPVTGVNPVAHVQARDNSVEGPADILPPLPQLPDGLNPVLPPLPQLPDSLNPVLTPVLSVASPVLNAVASIITPVLNAAAPIATPVLNAAQSLVDSTVPNLGGLDLLPALPQLPDSLNPVLTPALSAVSPILNAVPPIVTPVLNAAQSLVDSTVPSLGALNLPVLPQLPDSLNPVLTPALSAVSPILNAVPPIVTPVLNAVPPIVTPVLNAVPPIVTPVLDAVPPIVTPVLNAVPPIVTPVLDAIPPIVTPVLNAVPPIVTPVLNAVPPIVTPVLDAVPPIVTPVLNAVPPIVTPVLDAIPPIVTPVLNAVPPIVTPVLNAVPPIVTPVLNAIPPIVTPVLNAVAPIVTPILNAAQSLVDSTVPNLNALNLLPALAIGQGLSPLAPISPLSLPPADSLPLLGLLPPVPLGSAPPPFNPVVSPIAPGIGSLTPAPLAGTPAIPSLPNVAASPATAAPVLSATAPAKSIIVPVVNPVQNLLNTLRNFFGIHTAQVKRDTSVSAFPALNQDENHASLEQGDIQSIPNNAAHVIKAPAQRVSTLRHQELTRSSQAPFERREIVQETARDSLAGDVDQAASSTEDASESEPASGEYADDVLTEEADASSV